MLISRRRFSRLKSALLLLLLHEGAAHLAREANEFLLRGDFAHHAIYSGGARWERGVEGHLAPAVIHVAKDGIAITDEVVHVVAGRGDSMRAVIPVEMQGTHTHGAPV